MKMTMWKHTLQVYSKKPFRTRGLVIFLALAVLALCVCALWLWSSQPQTLSDLCGAKTWKNPILAESYTQAGEGPTQTQKGEVELEALKARLSAVKCRRAANSRALPIPCVQLFVPTETGDTVVLAVGETGRISLTRHTEEAAESSTWIADDQDLYAFFVSMFFP